MKGYFTLSVFFHVMLLSVCLVVGALLSKPRMSYYSVDLFSAMPANSSSGAVAEPPPVEQPKVQAPPKAVEEEKPVPKEAIRIPAKPRPLKKTPVSKTKPAAKPKSSAAFQAAMKALQMNGPQGPTAAEKVSNGSAASSGVVGEAGPAFPYPWYLKIIADKLDQEWHPSEEYASDTVCRITFVISRNGEVGTPSVEKASGDGVFDQLALRAVTNANPLPGLPAGYPEETLRVHMTFVGKKP